MKPDISFLEGVEYFRPKFSEDIRGRFTKVYSNLWSETPGIEAAEIFYSHSISGVIRGMHLQVNEDANDRIISVVSGKIFDVLLDLRPESKTYLRSSICTLSEDSYTSVKLPRGVAHGFQAIEPCLTLYVSSSTYKYENDSGIDATSIGIDWPLEAPLRSSRDSNLATLQEWLLNGAIRK